MAEFGTQATQLSAPQGAGSQPIAPVREQYVNDSILNSPIIGEVGDIIQKGLVGLRKQEQEDRKNSVLGGYVQEETAINNAVSTGQLSPSAAAARSRANANKYYAGYPQYIEDFEKAGKALRGFTEAGEVQEQLKAERQIRERDKEAASTAGFSFTAGMSKEAEDAQIAAHKTNVRVQQQLQQQFQINQEKRAQGTFDQAQADRDSKETAIQAINSVAGDNMAAFQAYGNTIVQDVKSGKRTSDEGQLLLTERFSNIGAAIQSAARLNPELAAPYRTLFNESNELFKRMLDPKAEADKLENELKRVTTRLKLVALNDPKFAATVTTSQLLGNNPTISFASSAEVMGAIARIAQDPASGFKPQVVGNPDVEPQTLKLLKSGLNQLKDPKTPNIEIQKVEAENSVNELLKQTGLQLNVGAPPERLKGIAEFFASPEYASIVTSGRIDKEAAQAAKKTFQLIYEPVLIQGIKQKLESPAGVELNFGVNFMGEPTQVSTKKSPQKLQDVVDIKFNGSGVAFVPKTATGLDPANARALQGLTQELNSSQKALNQMIHIGAHMEGTTNYEAYWNKMKGEFLPYVFSPYGDKLPIGTIKTYQGKNYRYIGGANTSDNWKVVE